MTTSLVDPDPSSTPPVYVLEPKGDHSFDMEPLASVQSDGQWLIAFTSSIPKTAHSDSNDPKDFTALVDDPDYRAFATQVILPK